MMDLHYYPLDIQNCTVEIESCEYINIVVLCDGMGAYQITNKLIFIMKAMVGKLYNH